MASYVIRIWPKGLRGEPIVSECKSFPDDQAASAYMSERWNETAAHCDRYRGHVHNVATGRNIEEIG